MTLDGPVSTTRQVKVGGADDVLAEVCKSRGCAENKTLLLRAEDEGVLWLMRRKA